MGDPKENRTLFIKFIEFLAAEIELPFYSVLSTFIGENTWN